MSTENDPKIAYLAVGAMGWGKGFTIEQAVAECRRRASNRVGNDDEPTTCKVYEVTPDAYVDGMGRVNWSYPPHVVEQIETLREHVGQIDEHAREKIDELKEPYEAVEIGTRVLFARDNDEGRQLNNLIKALQDSLEDASRMLEVVDTDEAEETADPLAYELHELEVPLKRTLRVLRRKYGLA